MEESKQTVELLEKLNASARKQVWYARLQCLFTLIIAVCFAGIFLMIRELLPEIQNLMTQLPGMLEQLEQILVNMEQVTTDLAAVDFTATVEGINEMVTTGQAGLQDTVKKLETIDFETLNRAIEDLYAVVSPLAGFMSRFG